MTKTYQIAAIPGVCLFPCFKVSPAKINMGLLFAEIKIINYNLKKFAYG